MFTIGGRRFSFTRIAHRFRTPPTGTVERPSDAGAAGDLGAGGTVSRTARLLAGLVLTVGLGASVLGALQWRDYIRDQQAHQVATTTATARASLTGAIQRDEDLVETMRGVVASGAPVTNYELQQMYTNIGATNDAGIIGLAYIEVVPYSSVPQFQKELAADPPLGISTSGPSILQTETPRREYCLIRLAVGSSTGADNLSSKGSQELANELSGHYDYCSSPNGPALGESAASGVETVTLLHADLANKHNTAIANNLFDVILPIYAPGRPLKTSAEREAALLGWADGLYSPLPILNPVAKTTGLEVNIRYDNLPGSLSVASAGPKLPKNAFHRTVRLSSDHRWIARISVVPSNASATAQGIGVLADLLVILLLVGLILVLFRSRKKAFESVEHKNRELEHRALHDTLTGLPNRDLILEVAATMLERAEEDQTSVAALLVDLDGFNAVNDTYGHRIGDAVLEAVAVRLLGALGPADMLGRLAGDEFVILVSGPTMAAGVEPVAERLMAELAAPIEVSGAEEATVRLSACIGVAVGPGRGAEDLLRDADTALNEAKSSGKRRYTVFEPAMHTAARSRLAMTGELRTAIEKHQFFLVYQPVFSLSDVAPYGVEALLRWQHPLRGIVPPLEFIPLLEETGMIAEVGREVLRLACEQAKRWEHRGLPIWVSVNASAIQIESEQFCQDVQDVLAATALDPGRLTIEITESALMRDAHEAVRRLGNLKRLGIRLAIDDFGTGYSSLAYLRQFPVDILKIDRSFVSSMTASTGGMALVRTMLELAKALNLETVAEGIEEQSELSALEMEHCRWGQGFLLAKPLHPDQIELFFDNARPRRVEAALST